MPHAIIDLGSNTFNLLVGDIENQKLKVIHQEKVGVKIGANSFRDHGLTEESMLRGLQTLKDFKETANKLNCTSISGFATSAIRDASNGKEFAQRIKLETGISIQIINGLEEAALIYEGVKVSGLLDQKPKLIMDIGGGSTEFIIGTKHEILWSESLNIGAARLLEMFSVSNPLKASETREISEFLSQKLLGLSEQLKIHGVTDLIGSSGSFDSWVDMIHFPKSNPSLENKTNPINKGQIDFLLNRIIASKRAEREQMGGLIPLRIDFIVMSSLLLTQTLKLHTFNSLWQCAYSLKEGALATQILKHG